MRTILFIASYLLASASLAAQVLPVPADHYELGIFRAAVSMTTPFTTTVYPPALVSCGRLPSERAPDGTPNPRGFAWTDPADATKECRIEASTPVIELPLGVGYRVAVRAIGADGTPSAWTFAPESFRRAPRGLPCTGANGLPGVLFVGENDLAGKPVRLTICVQQ